MKVRRTGCKSLWLMSVLMMVLPLGFTSPLGWPGLTEASANVEGMISGVLQDSQERFVVGAEVALFKGALGERIAKPGTAVSNQDGQFEFLGVAFGDYWMEVKVQAAAEVGGSRQQRVVYRDVVHVASGEEVHLRVVLDLPSMPDGVVLGHQVVVGDHRLSPLFSPSLASPVRSEDLLPQRDQPGSETQPGEARHEDEGEGEGEGDGGDEAVLRLKVKARKKWIQNSAAVSRTQLSQKQLSELPQGGEASLAKVLATTAPGVVLGGFGQMFVRGNHGNVQYQIDGVQLPGSPAGDFAQVFSPRNIDQMELITGGIPAEYGTRLAAIVNIVSKSGPQKPGGEVELNYGLSNFGSSRETGWGYSAISPHLLYGGSNEAGNFRYFFSANYQASGRGLNTPNSVINADGSLNEGQGGAQAVHDANAGNSEFAKLEWFSDSEHPAESPNQWTFLALRNANFFQIPNYPSSFRPTQSLFVDNPETISYIPSTTDDSQSESNSSVQLVWKHRYSENASLQLAPYYKFANVTVMNDPVNDLASLNLVPGAQPVSIAEDRNVNTVGLKGDYRLKATAQHVVKLGFQVQAARADGWVSFQTDPYRAPLLANAQTAGYTESLYAQDDYSLFPWLFFNVGVRFDAAQYQFAGLSPMESLLQPRLGMNVLATETTKLHVFYGRLFQPVATEALRVQYTYPNTLQPYFLKAEKDAYTEIGIDQEISALQQVLSATVYYKDMVSAVDEHQLYRTSLSQAFNYAKGFGYGFEVSLRGKITENWSDYFNYSYAMAQGLGMEGGIGVPTAQAWQVFDHIQEHTANLGVTYKRDRIWWTTQWLYGSGLRTGENNSLSMPAHHSLDTSVGYQVVDGKGRPQLKVSLDLLNVLDNRYPLTYANGLSGNQFAAGRQFFVRLTKEL